MQAKSSRRVLPDKLTEFCVEVFMKAGMERTDARTTAAVLTTTDTWGTFSHGTSAVRNYVRTIRAGGINPRGRPEVVDEGAAWAVIDGHSAMGMVSCCMAMDLAMAKAQTTTVAWVGVRNSSHFGAAGYYANMAASQNMIGVAASNTDPNMAVPGAKGSIIGNNPLAYAVPSGDERPIFLDIALSAVAAGKILTLKSLGQPLPAEWLADQDGLPTRQIGEWPLSGSLIPMAGHKGYGIALLIEVLAGVLTGAGILSLAKSWVLQPSERGNLGQCFLVINVGAIMPIGLFRERIGNIVRQLRQSPKAKGSERVYLPGEPEWEKREDALKYGIEFPEWVVASLRQVAEEVSVDCSSLFAV